MRDDNYIIRKFIRVVMQEEIARNYHTIDKDPYSWEDYPGIHINSYPEADGTKWYVQVTVDFSDKLSTPLRAFSSEEDANMYARQNVDRANRYRLANDIMTNTPTLSDIQ